jgi:nuclear pore complex protein Nup98-Nup96
LFLFKDFLNITFSLLRQAQLLISLCLGRSQQLNLRLDLEFLAVASSSRTRNSHHKLNNHLFLVAALDYLVISSHSSSRVLKRRIHVFFSTYLCFLTFLTQALAPVFGGSTTQQQGGTGLFGNSLFGNNQQQNQQQPASTGALGLFGGNKAPTPQGSFSTGFNQQQNATQPTQSLFGNTLGQQNQQSTLGGAFSKPSPLGQSASIGQSTGLFGSTLGNPVGSFNASANTQGAQGTLTASISQPIGANLPIFAMLPPGPRLIDLESQPKKKSGFFVDIPTRSPVPRVQLGYTPANSKLRGFGSSTITSSTTGSPFTASFTTGKANALTLNKSVDTRASSLGPDGFLGRSGSPSLGSGGRQSVKKVILDKKVDPSELFVKSGSPGSMKGGKVTFSPQMSVLAREKEAAAALAPSVVESPTPVSRPQRSPNRFTAQGSKEGVQNETAEDSTSLDEGDYWVKPDLAVLKKAGYDQLSAFEGLKVGRVGYGEITFLEPVDLTGLPKLGALLGEVVRFDDKECSVYPDSEEVDKPPAGSGLNVKARISLERCWSVDKATREPIKDPSHASAAKHLKRLKNMKDTHFEGFDIKTGTWTFTVDHF